MTEKTRLRLWASIYATEYERYAGLNPCMSDSGIREYAKDAADRACADFDKENKRLGL